MKIKFSKTGPLEELKNYKAVLRIGTQQTFE